MIKEQSFVWLEQLVIANLGDLFPGMKILEAHPFHVTRDADSEIQDLEAGDLLESVEEGVWQRRFADVVRVEIDEAMPAEVLEILTKNLELEREDIYKISGGPLSLVRVRTLTKLDRPDLKFPPFVPAMPAALMKDGGRGHLRRHPARRHSAASSVRFVPAGGGAAAEGGARSQRAGHQDHALSRGTQCARGRRAAGSGGERQAGCRAAGIESALRRGEQHRLGAQAGRIWRSRRVWADGPEGALQGAADCAQGRRRDSPLRASFHRQLQQRDRAALHRHRHDDLRSRDWRRLHRPVQLPDRILGQELVSQAAGCRR